MCGDMERSILDCRRYTEAADMALVVGENLNFGDWDDIIVMLLRRCEVFAAFGKLSRR